MITITDDDKIISEPSLNLWAQKLVQEYGPEIDYFLKHGSSMEKKLAQKVVGLARMQK